MTQPLTTRQMRLFSGEQETARKDTSSTFSHNSSLPIHRWFHYSAGFSALWVRDLIEKEKAKGRYRIFDPFAGSGTVLLESELCSMDAIGIDSHPFVARVARAKLYWRENPKAFRDYALSVLEQASKQESDESKYPRLITQCFPPSTLSCLDSLRKVWEISANDSPLSELTWLVLVSILRECSPVGTAQWQYVLPNKTKAKVADPYGAFQAKVHLMADDMVRRQRQTHGSQAKFFLEDARMCSSVPDGWADLVITSPPYANNYDYADAVRLEMSFLGEVYGWKDLQDTVRKYLIRSCTQHIAKMKGGTCSILKDPLLKVIHNEISEICEQLETEREKHGGRKPYHTMIAAYFSDMARVFVSLRRVTARDALICFVIGDSAPYGIYVPVDRWLGELAVGAGFKSFSFEWIRDRNVKWKNRKHSVPLHEGRLWIKG